MVSQGYPGFCILSPNGRLISMDVITTHMNADFDALASVMAAKKLYPDAVIVFPGSMEKKVRDFVDAFHPLEIKKVKDLVPEEVTRLIIVDTKHPDRIGPLKELLSRPGLRIHIYDHHPVTREDIKGEVEVVETAGALATVFAEKLQHKEIPFTPLEATILCLGIYQETGSLLFPSTLPRDLMAVAYLLKRGANLTIVSDFLKEEISREEFSLLNELVGSLREVIIHGVRVKIGKGTLEGFGDVAHLAHQVMDMEDTDAVFLLIGMADKILIVARSRAAELDVAHVLSEFGGGGHHTAASATIKDLPLEIVEERLVAALSKHVRPVKVAGDVMTKPVVVVPWNSTMLEAQKMMTRYGVNVLPVVKDDDYLGILTRGAVEKALLHGLGKNRCKDFATTDAITVTADQPVADVEKSMIEQNQRFVAVLDGARIVGAITRTDLLRSMYEDFLRRSRVSTREPGAVESYCGFGRNIASLLREKMPHKVYDFLVMAGEAADELGYGAYLVGGSVRDLLRGEENLDIDIVVEGDGIAFAKVLGKKMGAKVKVHQKFGTAQVLVKGEKEQPHSPGRVLPSLRIDVATSRTEYYESPAALPKVETSSIKRDLYRRDFTINTLAVRLNRKDFGHLFDFFGGQRDLKDRVVRVLHNLSIVEDPTRAFRAIRFSERFGFKITRHTENLIKFAIRMNIFEKLSGMRLYDEMMLIFNETNPVKAIKRLGEYGLLKVIHPGIALSQELDLLLQSVHDTITWFELLFLNEEYDRGLLYIMALLWKLNQEGRVIAFDRLSVNSVRRLRITEDLQDAREIVNTIKPEHPAQTYHVLADCAMEAVLFSMALTQDNEKKRAVSHYLLQLRKISPLLKGADLQALGISEGPVYSEMFRKILDEKLAGKLATKEDELKFVKNLMKK